MYDKIPNDKKLADEITEEVWKKYLESGDVEIRNKILLAYMYVVKCVANQMRGMFKNYAELDDIVDQGVLILIDAIDRFDLNKGVKFSTFASIRIRGGIVDFIRKQDWIPRSVRKMSKRIEETYSDLRLQYNREPTDTEISEKLGITSAQLSKAYVDTYSFNMMSYEEIIAEGVYGSALEPADKGELSDPVNRVQKMEMRDRLASAIDSLSERQRMVVSMYYYDNLKLKEIAKILGVSESRICQIHSAALMKMKSGISDYA